MTSMTRYPFEAAYAEIEANLDAFIDAVFDTLQSSFLVLPRGPGFVPYREFQDAYEVLKRHTVGFAAMDQEQVMEALAEDGLAFVVLRTILGFTAPELAYVASQRTGIEVPQGYARAFDRRVRNNRQALHSISPTGYERVLAMVLVACQLLAEGAGEIPKDMIHRLDKADTGSGLAGVRHLASAGVPYAVLLYERFLGRPFAGHRDAVSALVGQVMEVAIVEQLHRAGISFRETARAERIVGFDQAPDFIIPDEWHPQIVIEAKMTEDDGTARDKVTRIQHLAELGRQRQLQGLPGFQIMTLLKKGRFWPVETKSGILKPQWALGQAQRRETHVSREQPAPAVRFP